VKSIEDAIALLATQGVSGERSMTHWGPGDNSGGHPLDCAGPAAVEDLSFGSPGEGAAVDPEVGTEATGSIAVGTRHKIRVLLVDDHAVLRAGMASLLSEEPDMEVVGEAGDGQTAVELAVELQPEVILMDVTMPRLNGIEATRRIVALLPQTWIIGLSMHDQENMAQAMRKAGARAYLSKDGQCETLLAAIRDRRSRASLG
jgi:CheY-like chemotaxis protein